MLRNDVSMTSFAFVYSSLLIMVISKEDKISIKNLWKSKGYSARRFIKEFPDKNWNRTGLDYACAEEIASDGYCGKEGW